MLPDPRIGIYRGLLRVWPRKLGDVGEALAARYLRRRGYIIVARQFRNRFGEIDLVAIDNRVVVFVEVKTRRGGTAVDAVEAVTPQKQRRISRLAMAYLRRHDLLECAARFDVMAVVWPADRWSPRITHIPSAFEPVGSATLFG